MGGLGTLKYAFKYPHLFAGAAAQQPAMVCGDDATVLPLEIDQMATNSEDNIETYGAATMAETDRDFFRGFISPIAMCLDHAAAIRESGVKIYLDVGDRDFLGLANAAELMHRVLWEQRIEHEYHLVHLGDHAGSSWRNRGPEAMDFLFRTMDNALDPVDPLTAEERVLPAVTQALRVATDLALQRMKVTELSFRTSSQQLEDCPNFEVIAEHAELT